MMHQMEDGEDQVGEKKEASKNGTADRASMVLEILRVDSLMGSLDFSQAGVGCFRRPRFRGSRSSGAEGLYTFAAGILVFGRLCCQHR